MTCLQKCNDCGETSNFCVHVANRWAEPAISLQYTVIDDLTSDLAAANATIAAQSLALATMREAI